MSVVGAIARNTEGRVVAYSIKKYRAVSKPLLAEALGMRNVVEMAIKNNWQEVFIEGNNKTTIEAITKALLPPS